MKKLLLILLLLLIGGCASNPPLKVVNNPNNISISFIDPSSPAPMNLKSVTWHVYSYKKTDLENEISKLPKNSNLRSILIKMVKDSPPNDENVILFTLDTKNYENLGLDMQEVLRYLKQQKVIIIYYKTSISQILDQLKTKPQKIK